MGILIEVMDSTNGFPAADVSATLWREVDGRWHELASTRTDDAGRVTMLDDAGHRGRYRLMLDLDRYFAGLGVTPYQSRFELVFRVFRSGEHTRLLIMVTSSSCSAYLVMPVDIVNSGRPAKGQVTPVRRES